jgi:hypothetical protein
MNRIRVIAVCAVLCLTWIGTGFAISAEDEAAIKATALDYLEGWYSGDAERMERALHPDLAKRVIRHNETRDRDVVDQMSALTLIQYTRAAYGAKTPKAEQRKDVMILDVYENIATVKTVARDFVDYIHIGRVNGEWKIINVLWAPTPKEPEKK